MWGSVTGLWSRTRLKLMHQRTDGQRSESCIHNETLQRNKPRALISEIPKPSWRPAPGSPVMPVACRRHDDHFPRARPLRRRRYPNFAAAPHWASACCRQTAAFIATLWTEVEQNKAAPSYSPELLTSSGSFVVPSEKICSFLPLSVFPPQRAPDGSNFRIWLTRLTLFRFFEASSVFAGLKHHKRRKTLGVL